MPRKNGWVALKKLEVRLLRRRNWVLTFFAAYLSALAVFSVIGDRGLWASFKVWRRVRQMESSNAVLGADVSRLRRDVVLYRSDARTIEKYAREQLNMGGQDEIQVTFE